MDILPLRINHIDALLLTKCLIVLRINIPKIVFFKWTDILQLSGNNYGALSKL